MKSYSILVALFLLVGCDSHENGKCPEGTVVNYNCCSGIAAIALTAPVNGAKTLSFNGTEYRHVILVPAQNGEGEHIFMTLRKFKPEKDQDLLNPICLCVIGTDQEPTHVITASSTIECP